MDDYLELVKDIAHESAEIATKYFGFDIENTWKSDDTPLTKADTEINALVISKINSKYPDHSVLGEEESNIKEDSKYIWVCDPIDGTMPFSCGLPIFTFSLALVDQSNGQPILGVVNDPILKNMYWGYKGGGSYRNGKRLFVNKNTSLKNACLEVDDPTSNNVSLPDTQTIKNLRDRGAKIMRLVSFIYGGIQVANGKFSGAVFLGPYARDVAALKIITEEAGGKVTDLNGEDRRYDRDGFGCVVSNAILHKDILETISRD